MPEKTMALISIIEGFHPLENSKLIGKAEELRPVLHHDIREPKGGFQLKERYSPEKDEIVLHRLSHLSMGKGENLCLDFGEHMVGYVTLELSHSGSHPDAPAYLKLKFSETLKELSENSQEYKGWLSTSWIQEEYIHVDVLPYRLTLPRRYAFRYLKITMMDTSPKYKLVVKHAECVTETSADWKKVKRFDSGDELLNSICRVSLRTLAGCMHEEFEDGPKRDRRLWLGDFRLQALTNYISFKNYNLVKRCLYLFGGSRFPDGRVSANVFTKPVVEADDTFLFDYALMYPVILEEYLEEKNDRETLDDLYDIAVFQIDAALSMLSDDYTVAGKCAEDSFIDWCDDLDREAAIQGVLIYSLEYARKLSERKKDTVRSERYAETAARMREAAVRQYWDPGRKLFVSNGQISMASQIWMTLADVPSIDEAQEALGKCSVLSDNAGECVGIKTPYLYHYYIMSLIRSGLSEEAVAKIKSYWGGMLDKGADTFWECWDGRDETSPYGGNVINSYCHAWSCTPAYIIERHLAK